ncbi:UNVERIFIED_CONTAM: Phosphoglycerate mutase-like protein 4 [Sesamum angustifolium]|uniref:Phosphoglycerate mutase-like protein 4 n=1 Tax=Sesamum angustifolium TaxID=2727405 RepID=A0AAW2NJ86_9LAMI
MAASRDSVPSQYGNGGLIETVGPKDAEIVVIRHGETKWNADRRIQGQLDVDLSDIGRKQAFAVADRLSREPKISAVYSSDLKRALDTAEIIAKSCGVLEGGGESFNQLYNRCTSALQSIAKKHRGDRVVVVSHGAAIEALHKTASPSGNCKGKVLNASVNVFHLSDEDEWIIKSWGDVSHLNQTGFLESGFGGDRKSG